MAPPSAPSGGLQPSAHRLERPLGVSEALFHGFAKRGAFLTAQCVELSGPLTEPLLRAALAHLQERHPALRAQIVGEVGAASFHTPPASPPPLRVLPASADAELCRTLVEEQLHLPYEAHAPLWRVVWSPGAAGLHRLIFGLHHSIADGLSGYVLVLDLLATLEALHQGGPPPPLLPPSPALEDVVRRTPLQGLVRQKLRNLRARLLPSPPVLLPAEQRAPAQARRTRLYFGDVPAALLTAVQARARSEQTTVNGALCAAVLCAAGELWPGLPQLSLSTLVSLRSACVPKVPPEAMGCFATNVRARYLPRQTQDFWPLARACTERVRSELRSGVLLAALRGAAGWLQHMDADLAREVADPVAQGRTQALVLTNRGLQAAPAPGHFRLHGYRTGTSNHTTGNCLQLACGTVNGDLQCSLMYVEPLMSEETARRFFEATVRALQRAV